MNNVQLVGRLTADPEVRYTTGENSNATCRFSIAVQRRFKNAEGNYEADFPNCVAFRNNAEFISKYFHKGSMIGIVGNLRTGSYTNKDGIKVYTTDVVVDNVEFVGSKSDNESQNTTKAIPSNDTSWMNVPDTPSSGEENLPW